MNTMVRDSWRNPRVSLGMALGIVLALVLGFSILATGELAIYGLAAVLLFCVFLRYPALGLYLTTALLLLSGSATVIGDLRVRVPVTTAKICGLAAFVAWLTHATVRRHQIRFGPVTAVLVTFFAWCGLGIAMSATWRQQWPEWVRLGTLVAYFFLAINVLNTPSRLRTFVIIILLCGLGMALFALAQYFITDLHLEMSEAIADIGVRAEGAFVEYGAQGGRAVRVSGGTGHSNWLAMVILVIMPLNAYWFMTAKRFWSKALALTTVLLEIVALVLTFTRTGFFVGVIVLVLLALRNLVRFTPQRVAIVAVALFLSWFLIPRAYKERVFNFTQYGRSDSVINRFELQKAALEQTAKSPVWGVGLGGYGPRLLEQNTRVSRTMRWFVEEHDWPPQFIGAHNMYLQVLCETGIVGLGLLLAFFALLWRDLQRANRAFEEMNHADGVALTSTIEVGLIAFLICAVFLHALQQKIWWMVAATAAVAPLYQMSVAESRTKGAEEPDRP